MSDSTQTTAQTDEALSPEGFALLATGIERQVGTFIVGQAQLVRQTLISLIAGSHALLEGVPGLGKTMLVRTMAEALDLGFSRIQFTPDLMPADIIGTNIIVGRAASGASVSSRARSSATSSSPMRSTARRRRRSRLCWKPCRSTA